jgi:hypothetical protein
MTDDISTLVLQYRSIKEENGRRPLGFGSRCTDVVACSLYCLATPPIRCRPGVRRAAHVASSLCFILGFKTRCLQILYNLNQGNRWLAGYSTSSIEINIWKHLWSATVLNKVGMLGLACDSGNQAEQVEESLRQIAHVQFMG